MFFFGEEKIHFLNTENNFFILFTHTSLVVAISHALVFKDDDDDEKNMARVKRKKKKFVENIFYPTSKTFLLSTLALLCSIRLKSEKRDGFCMRVDDGNDRHRREKFSAF
jgi:hypothetical protein